MRTTHRYRRITLLTILLLACLYFWGRDNAQKTPTELANQPMIAESEIALPKSARQLWQLSAGSAFEPTPQPDHNLDTLRTVLRRDDSAHTVTTQTDGTKAVNFGGSYQTVAAAQRTDDGQIIIQCFERYQPVENFLLNPPQPKWPATTRTIAIK